MKAVIRSVFHKIASLFRKVGSLFGRVRPLFGKAGSPSTKVGPLFHKVSPLFRKVSPLFAKVGSLFRRVGSLFHKVSPLFGKVSPLFTRVGSLFRKVSSLSGKLIGRLWLLPPGRRIDRLLQRTWRRTKPPEYRFLAYVTTVLRVLGWALLVIGVLASIVLGLKIMNGGWTVWETQLRGVGAGVSTIILGIVGSFLAWLFVLVSRELVCLFIQVKENTRNTARRVTNESN